MRIVQECWTKTQKSALPPPRGLNDAAKAILCEDKGRSMRQTMLSKCVYCLHWSSTKELGTFIVISCQDTQRAFSDSAIVCFDSSQTSRASFTSSKVCKQLLLSIHFLLTRRPSNPTHWLFLALRFVHVVFSVVKREKSKLKGKHGKAELLQI